MTHDDDPDDTAFDAALSAALKEDIPVETPMLARAVLTRLAEEERLEPMRPSGWGTVALDHPERLALGYGVLLLLAAGLGYALMPFLGGEDALALLALGEAIGLSGGF